MFRLLPGICDTVHLRLVRGVGCGLSRVCGNGLWRRWGSGWRGGGGWFGEAVVVVAFGGAADAGAPAVGVEGVDEFVLGEMDGLDESLGEVGERGGSFRLHLTVGDSSEEAAEGETEIAGGNVLAGKEEREVLADCFGGCGLGFFAGVVETEMRMVCRARSAATATVGKGEGTQGHAVLGTKCRHGSSPGKIGI